MIREIALLTIAEDNADAFEAAVAKAAPAFRRAEGCHSMALTRSIEHPGRYRLEVVWDSVDAHMVTFRQSENFQTWRGLVGGFFIAPPEVEHTELIETYF